MDQLGNPKRLGGHNSLDVSTIETFIDLST